MKQVPAFARAVFLTAAFFAAFHPADAQLPPGQLDPAHNAPTSAQIHAPLPEESIWTAGSENDSHATPRHNPG